MKFRMIVLGLTQIVWAHKAPTGEITLAKKVEDAEIYTDEEKAFTDRKFMFTQLPHSVKIEFEFI